MLLQGSLYFTRPPQFLLLGSVGSNRSEFDIVNRKKVNFVGYGLLIVVLNGGTVARLSLSAALSAASDYLTVLDVLAALVALELISNFQGLLLEQGPGRAATQSGVTARWSAPQGGGAGRQPRGRRQPSAPATSTVPQADASAEQQWTLLSRPPAAAPGSLRVRRGAPPPMRCAGSASAARPLAEPHQRWRHQLLRREKTFAPTCHLQQCP